MKLSQINESSAKDILAKIHAGIMNGNSDLKEPLANKLINVTDIAKAIKNERCLCLKTRDFGNTYLEQIVGNVIRDHFPVSEINAARILFGLEKMTHDPISA